MVKSIQLRKGIDSITISPNEWANVILEISGKRIDIGSDSRKVIVERMIHALSAKNIEKKIGDINEIGVSWITSLSEKHSSLYIGDHQNHKYIFVQNDEGMTIGEFRLNNEEKEDWIKILTDG